VLDMGTGRYRRWTGENTEVGVGEWVPRMGSSGGER
jgi:hypothetical protein